MQSRSLLLSGILVVLLAGACAQAATVFVDGFKYSDPKFETGVQVNLAGVADVTGVDALAPNGAALTLLNYTFDQYAVTAGPFPDLTTFVAATAGNWRLTVHFGASGSAVYDFTASNFGGPAADLFPPAPTMTSPLDGASGVSPTPTFTWNNGGTHTGPLESLFVNVWSTVNPAVGQFTNSFGGIGLNDQTWTPSVVLPAGGAAFLVQYETNLNEDVRVDVPVYNAQLSTVGDPKIVWDTHSGDLFCADLIGFTVVPEPCAMLLLGLGALGLLRRRGR